MVKRATPILGRVLLHVSPTRRVVIDPEGVYYLEAVGDETTVRRRRKRTLRDLRSLGEVFPDFEPHGFHRVHRGWTVNLRRVGELRAQRDGRDWEVVMKPPVNRVIPVSRAQLRALLLRFGR